MFKETQTYEEVDGAEISAAPDFRFSKPTPRSPRSVSKNGGFAGQVKIKTLKGDKPVSELQVGDMVLTRDNGFQEIRWVGRLRRGKARQKMMVLKADTLAPGVPSADLKMSPNQRVLTGSGVLRTMCDNPEALVKLEDLTSLTPEFLQDTKADCWHILMSRHEVVLANDVWTETLQPDRQFLNSVEARVQQQLECICPKLATAGSKRAFPAARTQTRLRVTG